MKQTQTDTKTIRLVALYARVSTVRQEDEQTIRNQLDVLRERAKESGYTIVEEYTDDGWSGDMLARPALDKLRQDAKQKVWDAVLIYDPDRLARRYSYQSLVTDELTERGIEVIFYTVPTPKNPEEKILHGVRGLFAEYERAKISERFRLGKLRKIREGHILVSRPLYGYDYVQKKGNEHGYYTINEAEARVVRMIFSWVTDEQLTIRKVVKRLHEMGIKPRMSGRGVWNTSTLSTILRNTAYIGEARWGSSYAVVPEKPYKNEKYKRIKKSSRRIKPQEEWLFVPVPPLISNELFEKTARQLERNFALNKRNRKNDYLLSGILSCECGCTRTGEGVQKNKHLYYRCSDRVKSFPLKPQCTAGGINARVADELVWEKISTLMSSPDLLEQQAERWFSEQQKKVESSVVDVSAIKTETQKLKGQLDRYSKGYGAGVFTLEQLREYSDPIKEQIRSLERQAQAAGAVASARNVGAVPTKKEIVALAVRAKKNLSNLNFERKRAIVLNTVEKVIGTQKRLKVYGYIPFDYEYKTIHRHRRTSQRGQIHALQRAHQKERASRKLPLLHH